MKVSIQTYIAITTFLLFFITILAALNYSFSWIFYLTVIGQVFLLIMVYKVLTDNYKTEKTFEDFYEDNPISQNKNELNYRK
ncbi:hypothetical protein [Polaribacter marinivivus]|jgi:hypothetical protein|uniref:Uncharacterized protein n=1 Tax=Polaribacter marinivivus TaxID=1524260 RepID=A0ABV8RAN3_9FLAO